MHSAMTSRRPTVSTDEVFRPSTANSHCRTTELRHCVVTRPRAMVTCLRQRSLLSPIQSLKNSRQSSAAAQIYLLQKIYLFVHYKYNLQSVFSNLLQNVLQC